MRQEGSASEAEALANDAFFYEKLAKEDPNSAAGDPAGTDVEFVQPVNTGMATPANDMGVVILQGRKGAGGVERGSEDENIPDKYLVNEPAVRVNEEDEEEDEYQPRHVGNDDDEGSNGGGDDGTAESGNEDEGDGSNKQEQVEEDEEPPHNSQHFTREFDSTADLLKEVEKIVKTNEKLTENSDDDVFWKIEYQHPRFD